MRKSETGAGGDSPYDSFAWFYDKYWAMPLRQWQAPALEDLLFAKLRPGARVLDLCCGPGHFVDELLSRGYDAVGLDSSREMLAIAGKRSPGARFVLSDASDFTLSEPVDAIVCLFDSLNHVLDAGDVQRVFHCTHAALKPGGALLFDMNTRAAYGERWGYTSAEIQHDHAFVLRGGFDPASEIGVTEITMFRLLDNWKRSDTLIRQRPWEVSDVEPMLETAGFTGITADRAAEDLGMTGHYGIGRVFVRACKSSV